MSQQWYYQLEGQTRGPLTLPQLQELIAAGTLPPQTPVIGAGMKSWSPASSLPAETHPLQAPAEPPPLPGRPRPTASVPRRLPARQPPSRAPLLIAAVLGVAVVSGLLGWAANAMLNPPTAAQTTAQTTAPTPLTSRTAPVLHHEVEEAATAPTGKQLPEPVSVPPPNPAPSIAAEPVSRATEADVKTIITADAATPAGSREPVFQPAAPIQPSAPVQPTAPDVSPAEPDRPQSKPLVTATILQSQQESGLLYQALDIHRQPKMTIPGAGAMAQNIRYQILSELKVGEAGDRGLREVSQHVIDTRLLAADPSSRATFAQALKDLIGWQFSYKLDSRGEVVEIHSPRTGAQIQEANPAGAKGFLVSSVMDEDGWKELAALSFFNPRDKDLQSQQWKRQITHNFQPLGSWQGETLYQKKGVTQDVVTVQYQHDLTYKPPAAGIALDGLPFKIASAAFKAEEARGVILFNQKTRRVQSAEEHFHVRGNLQANLLGQNLAVPVEENQTIKIELSEQNPWQQAGQRQGVLRPRQ